MARRWGCRPPQHDAALSWRTQSWPACTVACKCTCAAAQAQKHLILWSPKSGSVTALTHAQQRTRTGQQRALLGGVLSWQAKPHLLPPVPKLKHLRRWLSSQPSHLLSPLLAIALKDANRHAHIEANCWPPHGGCVGRTCELQWQNCAALPLVLWVRSCVTPDIHSLLHVDGNHMLPNHTHGSKLYPTYRLH